MFNGLNDSEVSDECSNDIKKDINGERAGGC